MQKFTIKSGSKLLTNIGYSLAILIANSKVGAEVAENHSEEPTTFGYHQHLPVSSRPFVDLQLLINW